MAKVAAAPAGVSDREARLAGLLYLGTIACGLFAEVAVRVRVRSADAATTASNIVRQEGWYRLGEAADVVMLCCYIVVTALLYRLFAAGARTLALVAAGFSLIGIAVLAVAGVLHLAPLAILDAGRSATSDGMIQLALRLHGSLYNISLIFFGVYCLLIGWLCLRTRLLPAPVGWLMMIGGLAHIVTKLSWITASATARLVPGPINMLPLLGEAALALWLLICGLRRT